MLICRLGQRALVVAVAGSPPQPPSCRRELLAFASSVPDIRSGPAGPPVRAAAGGGVRARRWLARVVSTLNGDDSTMPGICCMNCDDVCSGRTQKARAGMVCRGSWDGDRPAPGPRPTHDQGGSTSVAAVLAAAAARMCGSGQPGSWVPILRAQF